MNIASIAQIKNGEKYKKGEISQAQERLVEELNCMSQFGMQGQIELLYELSLWLKQENKPYCLSGATASSYLLYILGISKTNPLKPHYVCPACGEIRYSDQCRDGFDLPEQTCACGTRMQGDGHDIDMVHFWGTAEQRCRESQRSLICTVSAKSFDSVIAFIREQPYVKQLPEGDNAHKTEFWVENIVIQKSACVPEGVGRAATGAAGAGGAVRAAGAGRSGNRVVGYATNQFMQEPTMIAGKIREAMQEAGYHPASFEETMKIYGLSHGSWRGRQQDIIDFRQPDLIRNCMAFYDDVFHMALQWDRTAGEALDISEQAHWGKGWQKSPCEVVGRDEVGEWLGRTIYMFPKAHAIERCLMMYEETNHRS